MGSDRFHFLILCLVVVIGSAAGNSSVPALFAFGDSYVDTGNNNYVATYIKANFAPYGLDFTDQKPTGRCNNARSVADFFVSYLGIKNLLPPYLEPNLSIDELKSGVSFGSAGSGFDPLTASVANQILVEKQSTLFGEWKAKLEDAIGEKATREIVAHAVYFVNAGINDIANNYYLYPTQPAQYTIEEYIEFLISRFQHFIKDLVDQGARRFAVAGVPPLGCIPAIIDRFSEDPKTDRRCIEKVEVASRLFNGRLQHELGLLQTRYEDLGARFTYLDQYQVVQSFIQSPNQYGFDDVDDGCCTSKEGWCLPDGLSTICSDRSKYVFWDFVHLTDKSVSIVLDSYRRNIDSITSGDNERRVHAFLCEAIESIDTCNNQLGIHKINEVL